MTSAPAARGGTCQASWCSSGLRPGTPLDLDSDHASGGAKDADEVGGTEAESDHWTHRPVRSWSLPVLFLQSGTPPGGDDRVADGEDEGGFGDEEAGGHRAPRTRAYQSATNARTVASVAAVDSRSPGC